MCTLAFSMDLYLFWLSKWHIEECIESDSNSFHKTLHGLELTTISVTIALQAQVFYKYFMVLELHQIPYATVIFKRLYN